LRGIEKGHGNPTWATLMAILAGMNVSLGELAKKMERGG
jgi:DNA-binding phage protein